MRGIQIAGSANAGMQQTCEMQATTLEQALVSSCNVACGTRHLPISCDMYAACSDMYAAWYFLRMHRLHIYLVRVNKGGLYVKVW